MMLHLKTTPRRLGWLLVALVAFEFVIVSLYVVTALASSPSQIGVLFNLDAEANIPTWFSAVQLFSIGVVILLARQSTLREVDHLRGLLTVLGAAFIFLSMDEAAAVHEKVTTVMTRFDWAPRFSGGHGIWMFVYVGIAVAMVAALFRPIIQVCRCYPRDVLGVAVGLMVLAAGAVGVEAIGYEWVEASASIGVKTMQVAAEEWLEMLGASIVLVASLRFALRDEIPARTRQPVHGAARAVRA